ncbi:DUF4303 domain-containing protein [Paracoccus zhejiangensis]|uniref:DUF4303 domain-containing protein n=1 Tax=Paracoccus zhejiangensis TaxID=1077935 RepID=A0A2H5F425_9RHOB|nr:DUF4303 domain-containing protein [Paracoccus zhejiangensis]AUH66294.1 hypothetical protein CX676_10930 [Paracoccus zhejiangensis]
MMSQDLANLIATAARTTLSRLFEEHPEDFYYCTLITTAEGLPPAPSAWSWQALDRVSAAQPDPEKAKPLLKWSYSESPYWLFGDEAFEPVRRRFAELVDPHSLPTEGEFVREVNHRLAEMEKAMKMLDDEGLFGVGARREGMVVLVEVMPPDEGNTERALRLNSPGPAIETWLDEAGE